MNLRRCRLKFRPSERRMVINKEPIVKLTPSWVNKPQPKQCSTLDNSYKLDLHITAKDKDSKIYVMYIGFILNGNYLLCMQRRTVDFRRSTFQVIITPTKHIQDEVNKFEKQQKNGFTARVNSCENVFDINFTEVYQVELHNPDTLTIVGMKSGENYTIRQYRVKASKHDIFLKNEFSLSLTTKQLIIKDKKTSGVFKNLNVPAISQFVLTSLFCENHVTCFVYSISTYNCENRWFICVCNSTAARAEERFKYVEIRENLIRGRITGISLLNNQTRIVLVTNTFQVLTYDIQKKRLALKYIRLLKDEPCFLECDQDFLYTQKITSPAANDGQNEVILVCSKRGKLYSIPGTYNPAATCIHSVDISTCLQDVEDNLYIEQFVACNFTKQCFLLCRSGRIYAYDLQKHRITQKYGIFGNSSHNNNTCDFMELPTFYYNLVSVNYYGDEMYYLKDNVLSVYMAHSTEAPPTLKEMCRKTILQKLPKRYVKSNKSIPTKIKRYLFEGGA